MSAEFVDDLPPAKGDNWERTRKLVAFATELKAHPGQWAKYPTPLSDRSLGSRATDIRNGRITAFGVGQFEAAVRDRVLYVRAVPE